MPPHGHHHHGHHGGGRFRGGWSGNYVVPWVIDDEDDDDLVVVRRRPLVKAAAVNGLGAPLYRPMPIPRPVPAMHMAFGSRLPVVRAVPTPHGRAVGMVRLATVVRAAPENAGEAMAGLGALGDETATASPGVMSSITSALNSSALSSLVGAGIKFYTTQQEADAAKRAASTATNLAQLQAQQSQQALQIQMEAARLAASNKSWIAPTVIAASVAALGLGFLLLRKKGRR